MTGENIEQLCSYIQSVIKTQQFNTHIQMPTKQ